MGYITENQFRPVANDVAGIKTALNIGKWIAGGLGVAVLTIGIGAFTWCYNIGVQVGKLEQADLQRGVELVSELKAPKSQQQLQANLTTITAQIETAKADGKPPDASKVQPLSSVLSNVVRNNPDMPTAWNAAMELVNYRFQPTSQDISRLPDCLNLPSMGSRPEVQGPPGADGIPTHHPRAGPIVAQEWKGMVVAQNCRLDLDDSGNFASSGAAKDFEDAKRQAPGINYYILEVTSAYVTYKGGKLLPINEIRFKNCSFQIQPTLDVPDKRRQAITKQLLEAKSNEGTIRLPIGM